MDLLLFRSLWGVPDEPWSELFPKLKRLGYYGIECSLGDIGTRDVEFKELLQAHGLKFTCGVYTSWQDYEGPWENKSVTGHLETYAEQLQRAKTLSPIHINVHSGSDSWSREQCEEFFSKAVQVCLGCRTIMLRMMRFQGISSKQLESALGVTVSHETHRGRALFNPFVTGHLLNKFPTLYITADWSHWVVVCERLLNDGIHDEEVRANATRVWSVPQSGSDG